METKQITAALIQFHSEVGKVGKNSVNPYFKSKYGDLNAYLEVIKEPLSKCGLALVQMPVTNGLKTILLHTSGERLESEMTIPGLPADPQKVGAALTYMRRYMLSAFLGLNAEDDDAESVRPKKQPIKNEQGKTISQLRAEFTEIYQSIAGIEQPPQKMDEYMSTLGTIEDASELQRVINGARTYYQKIIKGAKL